MTDVPPPVPAPNPPAAPWVVEPLTERVDLRDNQAEVTFTVKNPQATTQRAVLEIVPGDAVDASWFVIDGERQRPIEPNQSTQYKVTITAPAGTPVASYWFQVRVYAADVAPEESSTLSNRVTFAVAQPTNGDGGFPWWILAVIVALVLVIGVVGFIVTRDKGAPVLEAPTLVAPANGTKFDASTTTVTLVWGSVADAAKYRVSVTAPTCSVTPPTSAPPPTTEPPPPTPQPLVDPEFEKATPTETIFIGPIVGFPICGFRVKGTLTTTNIDLDGDRTSFDLTIDTKGDDTAVTWSVRALDDEGNEGPSSEARKFAQVP